LLLLRRHHVVGEAWTGGDPALREALRGAVERDAGAESPTDSIRAGESDGAAWRIIPAGTDGNLVARFVGSWAPDELPEGEAADLVEALAGLLGSRWLDRTALHRERSEKAQQERWFNTMDEQIRVLDRERQKFVAVVNQSDTFMFVVNPSYEIAWINRALQRYCEDQGHGVKGARLGPAWTCLRIDAPEPGTEGCPIGACLTDGQVRRSEMRAEGEDGPRDLGLTFLPIRGADGGIAEVLVSIQDLSGLDIVRRLEERYRRLFENSPDGMMMVDPETGRILLANPAAERLTALTGERLQGRSVQTLHDPDEWSEAAALYRVVPDGDERVQGEWQIVSATRRRITTAITCTRFEIDGRTVTLAQYRDITERRALETELRHSQKMEAVGSLAGGVAHDFNNLLTVILGKSELLAARVGPGSDLHAAVETIRNTAVRGSLLTRQLLSFSRKDVTRAELLDLNEVVRELEPLLDTLLGERIQVLTTEAPVPCTVRADRGQLEQIVMNLAVNARDAMPDGGRFRLVVSLEHGPASRIQDSSACWSLRPREGQRVVLEVTDEGLGMDRETMAHIFEPFYTTKRPGEGTGLGLSTVYGIVQEAGGDIDVTSDPGRGTTFRIHLPRERRSSTPMPFAIVEAGATGIATPPPVAPMSQGAGRVLLAEDEDDLRDMATEALELAGYFVVASSSG
ncbi:MAG TPA: ATP-binding protein, partial [bacterium]|nr:ATP-binding protein [bacterium]